MKTGHLANFLILTNFSPSTRHAIIRPGATYPNLLSESDENLNKSNLITVS